MKMLIPKGDNLVTYYILPMVSTNRVAFGRSFKSSYLSNDGKFVYVELSKNMHNPTYKKNPNYLSNIVHNMKTFVVFSVPGEFRKDVELFMLGKYSEFSNSTKKLIYQTSSLPYNSSMGNFKMSSPILQALDRTKTLRSFLLTHLQVQKVANSEELIDIPEESWFIENRFK